MFAYKKGYNAIIDLQIDKTDKLVDKLVNKITLCFNSAPILQRFENTAFSVISDNGIIISFAKHKAP